MAARLLRELQGSARRLKYLAAEFTSSLFVTPRNEIAIPTVRCNLLFRALGILRISSCFPSLSITSKVVPRRDLHRRRQYTLTTNIYRIETEAPSDSNSSSAFVLEREGHQGVHQDFGSPQEVDIALSLGPVLAISWRRRGRHRLRCQYRRGHYGVGAHDGRMGLRPCDRGARRACSMLSPATWRSTIVLTLGPNWRSRSNMILVATNRNHGSQSAGTRNLW
jgi:hypothetical protein